MSTNKHEFNLESGHREQELRKVHTREQLVARQLEKGRTLQERDAREDLARKQSFIQTGLGRELEQLRDTRNENELTAQREWTALQDRHDRQQALMNRRHNGLLGRMARTLDVTGTVKARQQKAARRLENRQDQERRKLQVTHERRTEALDRERTAAIQRADGARREIEMGHKQDLIDREQRYEKVFQQALDRQVTQRLNAERGIVRDLKRDGRGGR